MRLPVTQSYLRIVIVVVSLFVAINLVLYTSAVFAGKTTSREILDVNSDYRDHGNSRIFLRARNHQNHLNGVRGSRHSNTRDRNSGENSDEKHERLNSDNEEFRPANLMEDDDDGDAREYGLSEKVPNRATSAAELQPASTVTVNEAKDQEGFDIEKVLQMTQGCVTDNDEVSLDCYNNAYEELCKLFESLGAIFSFVISEIRQKIGILREYRKSNIGEQFRTIQSMVQYEVDHDLTDQGDTPSACRTLLRLHRALHFISALMAKARDMDGSRSFSEEAIQAYDKTLAKYNGWVMRKAVHVAMYSLPDRKGLLVKLNIKDTADDMAKVTSLIEQLNVMYDITQKLYTANNILDLP